MFDHNAINMKDIFRYTLKFLNYNRNRVNMKGEKV